MFTSSHSRWSALKSGADYSIGYGVRGSLFARSASSALHQHSHAFAYPEARLQPSRVVGGDHRLDVRRFERTLRELGVDPVRIRRRQPPVCRRPYLSRTRQILASHNRPTPVVDRSYVGTTSSVNRRRPPGCQTSGVRISREYTAAMPVDVAAEVIANHALSADYNVLALRAPEIAQTAVPGQFVMVKAGQAHDPLLRRPFSVFEVLRDNAGAPTGLLAAEQTHRSVDRASCTRRRRDSASPVSGRSAVRSRSSIRRPKAWMVAGGVGLAPFVTLAESLRARGVRFDAVLRRAPGRELFYLDLFRDLDVELIADHRRRQRRRARPRHRAARAASRIPGAGRAGHDLRMRTGRHARRDGENRDALRPALPGVGRAHHGMRPRRLLQLRRADARRATAASITCGRA